MGSIDIIIDKMIKMEQYIKELGTLKPNSFSEYMVYIKGNFID